MSRQKKFKVLSGKSWPHFNDKSFFQFCSELSHDASFIFQSYRKSMRKAHSCRRAFFAKKLKSRDSSFTSSSLQEQNKSKKERKKTKSLPLIS